MSVTIAAIDKTCDTLIMISDKRSTRFEGKRVFFDNDNSVKHHIVNQRVCIMPGSFYPDKCGPDQCGPDYRLALFLQFAHLPTSKLIEMAMVINRKYTNVDGEVVYDALILCGLNDDGKFFILSGQPDGTFSYATEEPGNYKLAITTNGEHLQEPAMIFLADRITKKNNTLLEGLKSTIKRMASTEKTVSKGCNFSIIKKQ